MNTDMRKFESSQKDESRAQLADSSKAYKKRRAFYCQVVNFYTFFEVLIVQFISDVPKWGVATS